MRIDEKEVSVGGRSERGFGWAWRAEIALVGGNFFTPDGQEACVTVITLKSTVTSITMRNGSIPS